MYGVVPYISSMPRVLTLVSQPFLRGFASNITATAWRHQPQHLLLRCGTLLSLLCHFAADTLQGLHVAPFHLTGTQRGFWRVDIHVPWMLLSVLQVMCGLNRQWDDGNAYRANYLLVKDTFEFQLGIQTQDFLIASQTLLPLSHCYSCHWSRGYIVKETFWIPPQKNHSALTALKSISQKGTHDTDAESLQYHIVLNTVSRIVVLRPWFEFLAGTQNVLSLNRQC